MGREQREFYWDVAKVGFAFAFGSSAAVALVMSGYRAVQTAKEAASAKIRARVLGSDKEDVASSGVSSLSDSD